MGNMNTYYIKTDFLLKKLKHQKKKTLEIARFYNQLIRDTLLTSRKNNRHKIHLDKKDFLR